MNTYKEVMSKEQIERAMAALEANGIKAVYAESEQVAKEKVLEMIPEGAEVMNMTSVTLDTLGLSEVINESGKYNSVRKSLGDKSVSAGEKRKSGGGPDWAVGSVHALTEDGKLLIASNTGSQLGAYAYGAAHVIWVVGAQKIVKNVDEGMKRVYDYVLPLESMRANKAYNITNGSAVRKLLIINSEGTPGRATAIVVNEALGF